jgi:hypothetical protein
LGLELQGAVSNNTLSTPVCNVWPGSTTKFSPWCGETALFAGVAVCPVAVLLVSLLLLLLLFRHACG